MPDSQDEPDDEFRTGDRRLRRKPQSPISPADRAKVQAAARVLATKIYALCIDKARQLSVPTILDVNSVLMAETIEAVRKRL